MARHYLSETVEQTPSRNEHCMETFIADLTKEVGNYYSALIKLLPRLAVSMAFLLFTFLVARQIKIWIKPWLIKHTDDRLLAGFLTRTGYWIMLVIGISISLSLVGLDGAVTKILAGAGISAFILGFALKDIGENFLAGILLAFQRPFKIGDLVETQNVHGRIIGLNLRETIIKTIDGKDVYVPNGSILKNPLFNYSVDSFLRLDFSLKLDKQKNYTEAIALVRETLSKTSNVLNEEEHSTLVSIEETQAAYVLITIFFWITSQEIETTAPVIKTEVMQKIMITLDTQGFIYGTE